MAKKIYGLTEAAKRRLEKALDRTDGGFRRRRPTNKRRRGMGGGDSSKLVAIVETLEAATVVVSGGKATITPVEVTAKTIAFDATGKPYYESAAASDVACKWYWAVPVTIASGKWRLGRLRGGQLELVDCADRDGP